jgi:hypothetical protein
VNDKIVHDLRNAITKAKDTSQFTNYWQIKMIISQRVTKKSWFGMTTDELHDFEQWNIRWSYEDSDISPSEWLRIVGDQLRNSLLYITTIAWEQRQHIPLKVDHKSHHFTFRIIA